MMTIYYGSSIIDDSSDKKVRSQVGGKCKGEDS